MTAAAIRNLMSHRFETIERAGGGGMGTVYRARDVQTNQCVALKLLNTDQPDEAELERFNREAAVLAALRHPGIVGYVGHGLSPEGQPFLAMEWLEGEDLATRLRRGRLSVPEVVTLLEYVGDALETAHQAGVVHRDLKPSNLFLRGGHCDRVAIVDFGIARYSNVSRRMTRTGAIVGTPDYMAPEQARGERTLGPAADIFSLGCVAYECLVGEAPFAAMHVAATLAKILFAEPEPLSHRCKDIPLQLAALVMAMLAKEPDARPPSVAHMLQQLSQLVGLSRKTGEFEEAPGAPRGLATDEQSLFCVIVVTPQQSVELARTLAAADESSTTAEILALRRSLADYDAQLEALADGSFVVSLGHGHGEATEQVARALQCARLLRERYPDADVVLATGRGQGREGVPMGEAIDRAGYILREQHQRSDKAASEAILLDEVSASLLRGRHRVQRHGPIFELLGESPTNDPSRPLLGQPTPCIGRESEFGVLDGMLDACMEEVMPRAMLITGAPGLGKSRFCHEFLRRLGQKEQELHIWMGSCDPFSAGTSYGPLSRTLRRLCNVQDSDSLDTKRERMRKRVAQSCLPAEVEQTVDFLGELCGFYFPDEHSAKLRAARHDPRLMSDLVTQALMRFIEGEGKRRPILWVIEDLQWCDAATVKALGVALRQLRDTAMLIVASARLEVTQSFPNLWSGYLQTLSLRPLGRKSSERLVQQLLPQPVDVQTMALIVARADGNPLWLEELIRTVAEGDTHEPPPTIMAILQARVGQLPSGARQLLRAASVFGETFWLGGIAALLRRTVDPDFLHWTQMLIERELWIETPNGRYAEQREFRFRHTLMRDAAYRLLTDDDRLLGHRLAGEFLEQQGESEAALLAAHARLGGDLERAIAHYSRAADQALAGNDLVAALRHAQSGLSCQPTGTALGLLLAIEAMVHHWGGNLQDARAAGLAALRLLRPGSRRWCQAMLAMWLTTTYLAEHDLFDSLRDEFSQIAPEPDAMRAYVEAASFLIVMTSLVGQAAESRMFLERLLRETAVASAHDDAIRGWVKYAHGVHCHWIDGNLWQKAQLARESINAANGIGDRRLRCLALSSIGLAEMGLGIYHEGIATFRQALREVEELQGETYLLGSTTGFFAQCLTEQGDPTTRDEAIDLARRCLQTVSSTAPAAGVAQIALAQAYMAASDWAQASQSAEIAANTLRVEPAVFPAACTVLAEIYLAVGNLEGARRVVQEGKSVIAQIGRSSTDFALFFQAAELAHRTGDHISAHEDLRECACRLARNVQTIPDPNVRRSYLHNVPRHGQILRRISQWLGEEDVHRQLVDLGS